MNKAINNKNTVLRYIVPFYVESKNKVNEQYEVIAEQLQAAKGYEIPNTSDSEKDLYEYIYDQIGMGMDTKELGCVYEKKDVKEYRNLEYILSNDENNEKVFRFKIANYKIYLFKTGVNFFCYDIEIKDKENYELSDLVEFQNIFKELVRKDYIIRKYKEEKTSSDGKKQYVDAQETYRGAEAIHKELTSIFATDNNVRYYSERVITIDEVETKVIDKPILYSYVSVIDADKLSDAYYKSVYYLSTGFTTKYEYNERRMEKVFRPFDNIIWEISKEGCCGLAVVENEKHYLYSDFKTRVKNDYFLLYILVLHQAHVMLDFSNMIARELPADYESYDDGEGKLYETIKKIKLRLNVFLARNVYTSVSHIQHHNEFYDYAVRRLDIEHDIQSVSAGLGALEKTQQMNRERYEQIVKEENNSNIRIIAGFLTFINTVSISLNLDKFIDELNLFLCNRGCELSLGLGVKISTQLIIWFLALYILRKTCGSLAVNWVKKKIKVIKKIFTLIRR